MTFYKNKRFFVFYKKINYKVNDFIPLWGDITLVEGTEVIGYLLVDLPKDVTINRLRWIASDTVTINY